MADRLIPLDEERVRAIEAVFDEVADLREQNRLAVLFEAQLTSARGSGSDNALRPPYLTYAVVLRQPEKE